MNRRFDKIVSLIPDKLYLTLKYYKNFGRLPNWKNPQTFSEKLQWLKLYDRKPEYTMMVDKYAVKDYVASIIGSEYVIPTLGVWDKPEDIEWEKLPNQFVLKTAHGGGSDGVVICRDKATFDKEKAIKLLNENLKTDLYVVWREWPYKNVPKRILAEQYIEPGPGMRDLPDYKWYCFNGEPRFCQLIQDRTTKETIDFFDTEWKHQDFIGLNPAAVHAADQPPCPSNLSTQLMIARKLSNNLPFVRIDLFEVNGKTYFGEITFYPLSGMGRFNPKKWNNILGNLINLPIK